MRDPRIDEYARLLVDRSVGVQPGWQVLVRVDAARAAARRGGQEQIARRGAYPILQLAWEPIGGPFAREAPLELLAQARAARCLRSGRSATRSSRSPRPRTPARAPTSPRSGASAAAEADASRSGGGRWRCRCRGSICEYPTNAAAQEAGMTLDGVRGVRLRRRAARLGCRGARMQRIADASSTPPSEVRIVGERDRPDALARGPLGRDRRRPHQHAGRRGLLLAGRGLGRGRGDVLRVPGRATTATRSSGVRFVFERGRDRRGERPRSGEDVPARARSTPTTARAGSASSGSAATRASSASRRTSASTRRSTARSTSRSATRTRRPAART